MLKYDTLPVSISTNVLKVPDHTMRRSGRMWSKRAGMKLCVHGECV